MSNRGSAGNSQIRCSFCGKAAEQVSKVVTGPGVHICNECVDMCTTILTQATPKGQAAGASKSQTPGAQANSGAPAVNGNVSTGPQSLPIPAEISDHLDKFVIGQDQAKRALAVAVYNHYKRLRAPDTQDGVEVEKSNILFVGPTGSGKTLLAQTLAKFLNVPFTIVDATVLTEAGYVGEDVDNIIVRLFQSADYDVARAEQGIIFVDEVDKIARKSANASITRDVSGEGVQQGLLKLLEGTVAAIPPKGGRKHPEQNLIQINTKNVLFICGGAFESIDKIISRRMNKGGIGFGAEIQKNHGHDKSQLLSYVEPDDLVEFGLIPELIGRLPLTVGLEELDGDALMKILQEPKNAIVKQYKKLFKMDELELNFSPDALEAIVTQAIERKTGARGLRSIIEKALLPIMYEAPSLKGITEVVITGDVINFGAEPEYISESNESKKTKKAS